MEFTVTLDDCFAFSFFCSGVKDDHIVLFPHVDNHGLSGEDMSSEFTINRLQFQGILRMELIEYSSCCHSVGTKSMKDGGFKATDDRNFWVNMDWVKVTIKSV